MIRCNVFAVWIFHRTIGRDQTRLYMNQRMLRRFFSSHSQWEHLLNSTATNQELQRLYQSIHVALSTKRVNRSLIPDAELTDFTHHYQTTCTTDAQKLAFLHSLATNVGLDLELLDDACNHWNNLRSQNHHHNNNDISNNRNNNSNTSPTTTTPTPTLITTTSPLTSDDRLMRAAVRLHQASKPIFSHLWAPISQQKGGMKLLVDMRADALRLSSSSSSSSSSSLRPLADSIKTSLSEWFSVGMLQLRQLTWEGTPAALLEKIVQGEAIHPYKGHGDNNGGGVGWVDDLKRRLAAEDRRVHAFFHPAMPDEPLMVLHAALLEGGDTGPPDNINTLLDQTSSSSRVVVKAVTHPHTAVFYSISSLQPGLQGIQMGDYLIKLVSQQLLQEFPTKLKTLITLSPIPNFSTWLEHHYKAGTLELPPSVLEMGREEMDVLVNAYAGESYTSVIEEEEDSGGGEHFSSSSSSSPSRRALFWWALNSHYWLTNKQVEAIIKPAAMHLAARYLAIEKRRGFALDPVANFHLRNGAELHNLVWRAAATTTNTTTTNNRMMDQSYGIMANYLYRLEDVAKNNAEYLENEIIAVGDQVKEMLQ